MRPQALDRSPGAGLEVIERSEAYVERSPRRGGQPVAQGVLVGVEESASAMADDDDRSVPSSLLADDQQPDGVLGG